MGIDCCHKRLQSYGNVSPQAFLETGRVSHSFSHKHIKADLYLCIKRCQSVYGVVHAGVSANGANPTSLDADVFKWKRWVHARYLPSKKLNRYKEFTSLMNKKLQHWAASPCTFRLTLISSPPVGQRFVHSWPAFLVLTNIHCKYSCDGCCPSRCIKELSGSGWQDVITAAVSNGAQSDMEFTRKMRFCSNDAGRGQNRSSSLYYAGKPDSFTDSKIVAAKWKQITDWNNRCGCINWVQCFYILYHYKGTLMKNSSTTSQRCLIKTSDDTKKEH